MSVYGFAGFPLRDSLPRGFGFIHMMRGLTPPPSSPTSQAGPAIPATVMPVPGGFNDEATPQTLSTKRTNEANGVVRHDLVKQFDDGSTRTEVQHKHPDGTFEITTERRSLPGPDGLQKVRVWSRTTAPDGSKQGTFRLFSVPDGTDMNWDSQAAQKFLVTSVQNALNPDGSLVPQLLPDAPGNVGDAVERMERETATQPRPAIPIAP